MTIGIGEAFGYELEPTPWAAHAACANTSPDLFFPDKGGSTAAARAVCATCPVTTECLDYALRWRIPHGIWGGTSERERRRLRITGAPGPARLPRKIGCPDHCDCSGCRQARWRAGRIHNRRGL